MCNYFKVALMGVLLMVGRAWAMADVIETRSPDQSTVIEHACSEQGCSAWVDGANGKTPIVDNAHTTDISVQWLSNDLADVHFSCGSPCTAHFFYGKRQVSARNRL